MHKGQDQVNFEEVYFIVSCLMENSIGQKSVKYKQLRVYIYMYNSSDVGWS